jgi:methylenetetrahydrofolate reductase (NADPH)
MHLTCTNISREKIDVALAVAKQAGIQNILALRGDPPRNGDQENGGAMTCFDDGLFAHAIDLIKYIRKTYGDYFCIGVAGYPEGHPDSEDVRVDIQYLKEKMDAGADYIVTQMFYNVDLFVDWVDQCRRVDIQAPILPGMMIIQNYSGFKRMTSLCKIDIPEHITMALDGIKEDDQAVKDYGIQMMIEMCQELQSFGFKGFHFYTMNLERSCRLVLEGLCFIPKQEIVPKLPFWNPLTSSSTASRKKQSDTSLLLKAKPKSVVLRTQNWDEFPNGRWGDSQSPAFGDLDGYGVQLKHSPKECIQKWGIPASISDLCALFVDYIVGKVDCLPWCDGPLDLSPIV